MDAKEKILEFAKERGLTMSCEFVPWSKSRNAGEKDPSLNWRVTLRKNRLGGAAGVDLVEILTTDYSAGCGHAPFHKKIKNKSRPMVWEHDALVAECEAGFEIMQPAHYVVAGHEPLFKRTKPILPEFDSVLAGLVLDSDVLNHPTFESWALDLGYDPDSRKGEAIYRSCLESALKLRNALGDAGLEKLREACQDY